MAENIPTTAADLQPITEAEMNANSVESLNNRPNDLQRYGTQGMTPAQLKAWYDRLARMAIAKINKIIEEGVFKVTGATGELPKFDSNGKLVSSGIAAGDVATKLFVENAVALETAGIAGSVDVSIDSDYVLTISLKNPAGTVISTESIDLPLEAMLVNAEYNDGNLIVTLQNGNTVTIPLTGIINGLVKEASGEKTDGNLSSWEGGELGDSGIPKDKVAKTDGSYDLFTAGLAKNLQGRAASAVSADFTFRPSGGSADIGNPQATIKSIHGNTLVWNQLVNKATYESAKTVNGITFTPNADGSITINGTSTGAAQFNIIINATAEMAITGHKYLLAGGFASGQGILLRFSGVSGNIQTSGDPVIATGNETNYLGRPMYILIGTGNTFSNLKIYPQFFDLTLMFGAGNEPTTAAEFKALFSLSYYAYDAGRLLHFNGTGLKTVGFNQWDEEWDLGTLNSTTGEPEGSSNAFRTRNFISILPNTNYCFTHPKGIAQRAVYYDINKNFVSYEAQVATNQSYTVIHTPGNAYFYKFIMYETTYNHDICINLSHSGYRNGEYEPYWTSTLSLPVATYFPTGMKSAGSVYDELTETKAIQRVGTRAYAAGDESDSTVTTDGTTTCYALDTPVETDIDISLVYKVDDYGTEQLLPENTSTPTTSPFVGTIHYAMNAVDKLNRLPDPPSTTGYYTVYYDSATGKMTLVAEGSRVYQHDISMKNNDDEWLYFTCVNKNPTVTYGSGVLTGVPNGIYAAHTVDYGAGVVIVTGGSVTFYYGTSSKAWDGDSGVTDTATKIY